MIKLLEYLLLFAVMMFIGWILGSFVAGVFDVSLWEEPLRILVSQTVGLLFFGIVVVREMINYLDGN